MALTHANPVAAPYSSLVAAGLLAPPLSRPSLDRAGSPDASFRPRTPEPAHGGGLSPAWEDRSPTPTPANPTPSASRRAASPALMSSPIADPGPSPAPRPTHTRTASAALSTSSTGSVRSLRRRRSSITVATSPVPMLKTRAFAPSSFLARARSGSLNDGALAGMQRLGVSAGTGAGVQVALGPEGRNLIGRLRSGSLSGALRTGARRILRKPPTLPPSAPLPPVPSAARAPAAAGARPPAGYPSPLSASGPSAPAFASTLGDPFVATPRRASDASLLLSPEFAGKLAWAMRTPPMSPVGATHAGMGMFALGAPRDWEGDEAMREA